MGSWLCNRRSCYAARFICTIGRSVFEHLFLALATFALCTPALAADLDIANSFRRTAQPVLDKFCSGCHNSDLKKGGIAFDVDDLTPLLKDQEVWLKTLKMLRAGMMPPKGKRRPSAEQVSQVENWIKYAAFGIDPKNPDPGRVTIRRLNRTEYRNTIRDLLGVDFNATAEFPADDTGHGFDNISDVLTISPLLLEKYIAAAKSIVTQAVPLVPLMPAEKRIPGQRFASTPSKTKGPPDGPLALSYYKAATVTQEFLAEHAGHYQLVLDLTANETYVDNQFDYNKCRLIFKSGDKVLLSHEFSRQGNKPFRFEFEEDWPAGKQALTLEVQPLTPKERQVRSLTLRVVALTVRGPMAREHWVRPDNHERFFPGVVPQDLEARRAYARKVLEPFVTQAYRRPVDGETLDRLVRLAEATAAKPGQTFEAGMAQAMIVVLASPRFLFREEWTVPGSTDKYPLLDEYALASRLSYFLWSSMPDEELFRLAAENKLRQNLSAQVSRMLADKRSGEFMRNFSGQWLQARAIETANVNAAAVMLKEQPPDAKAEEKRARFRELNRKSPEKLTEAEKKELNEARAAFFKGFRRFAQFELTGDLRRAMRQETEMAFEHIIREDRSLLEFIDADYTFLNEKLAKHYGIDGVKGEQMRKVSLPPDSPRGGVLTQGTMLIITSNPDRTSPVKRGVFILDNILGMPPPPPPPNVPLLEQAAAALKSKTPPTLRETLKAHREDALCMSCHNRMDPLGLAFENFNALGRWRDKEQGQPIEPAGELLTGEAFKNVRELKRILIADRRLDFYRCATEKMLIYALGRGLEPGDAHAVDDLVSKLEAAKGRPSVLISGIIESPAFQRRRQWTEPAAVAPELESNQKSK
jgi:hypothetical protein